MLSRSKSSGFAMFMLLMIGSGIAAAFMWFLASVVIIPAAIIGGLLSPVLAYAFTLALTLAAFVLIYFLLYALLWRGRTFR